MILFELSSRKLGHQMFQLAFACHLAAHSEDIVVNLNGLAAHHLHLLAFPHVSLRVDTGAERERVNKFLNWRTHQAYNRLRKKVGFKAAFGLVRQAFDLEHTLDVTHPEQIGQFRFMHGTWQSEDFFSPSAALVRAAFTFPALPATLEGYAQQMAAPGSVALSMRQRDYLATAAGDNFYTQAMQRIAEQVPSPTVLVVTDNLDWAKETLRDVAYPIVFVEAGTLSELDQMHLLSRCQHHILSSQPETWWAAWLSSTAAKVVVAPDRYYTRTLVKDSMQVPSAWHIHHPTPSLLPWSS